MRGRCHQSNQLQFLFLFLLVVFVSGGGIRLGNEETSEEVSEYMDIS